MRTVEVAAADALGCAPYGRVFDLDGDGDDVIAEPIDGLRDRYTREPVVTGSVHVGLTVGPALPQVVSQMERHPATHEGLLCIGGPVVVLLSADAAERPAAESVRAFLVRPGQCVSLHPGVWHSAAYGIDGPSRYVWLAGVSASPESPWAEIVDGPVRVDLPRRDG